MIFRGILASALGGFICVRGYAKLGDLAKFSFADPSFQRDLLSKHKAEIVAFLDNRQNLFFPEVVLSCVLEYDFNKPYAKSGTSPLRDILSKKAFKSNVNNITLRTIKADTAGHLHTISIDIPDSLAETSPLPLFRIDGNHRISACAEKRDFYDYNTPFCILLFEKSDGDYERNNRTIFHNINSKSIPLTTEESLKVILDDAELFSDDELKTNPSFGWEYFLARKLKEKVDTDYFRNIAVFKENTRTALVALFNFICDRKLLEQNEDAVEKALNSLIKVNELYGHESRLSGNCCVGLLIAFIYYDLRTPLLLPSFKAWIINNHLYELYEYSATSLNTMAVGITTIFDKILDAKGKTIFVSMPFGEEKTEENFTFIKETVNEINKEYGLDIKIEPIRVDEYNPGHSFKIPDKILELISEAGLLIADLTYGNKNVYHELGYLMGLNNGRSLTQENFIMIFREGIPGQKESIDFEIGFNVRSDYQIRFRRMDDLKIKLKAMLLKHYSLA